MQVLSIKSKLRLIIFLQIIFSFFPICFNNVIIKDVLYINFIIQTILFYGYVRLHPDKNKYLLAPSTLSIFYILISFILGSYFFSNSIYLLEYQNNWFQNWENVKLITIYFNISTIATEISYNYSRSYDLVKSLKDRNIKFSLFKLTVLVVLLLTCLFIKHNYDIDNNIILISIYSLTSILFSIIVIWVNKFNLFFRILVYILIIGLLSFINSNDKRVAIMYILAFLIVEIPSCKNFIAKLSIVRVLTYLTSAGIVIMFVVFMSMTRANNRGNGDFSLGSFQDIVVSSSRYLSSEKVLPIIVDNLEINYVFINSYNAINCIIENPDLLTYGQTYVKPLFIPIPRSLFPNKPEGIIHLYTKEVLPIEYNSGYCLPLTLPVEAFWNFHVFGLFATFLVFYFLNCVYKSIYDYSVMNKESLGMVFGMAVYVVIFMLCRDSGFSKLILNIGFSIIILNILKYIFTYRFKI